VKKLPLDIAGRVELLVDLFHRGSVNAAAKAMGIPQPTLAQIVRGKVKSPRAHVLQAIAGFYEISVDWILTGQGKGPDLNGQPPELFFAAREWNAVLAELELPSSALHAVEILPLTPLHAAEVLLFGQNAFSGRFEELGKEWPEIFTMYIVWMRAWTEVLRMAIDHRGAAEVRRQLVENVDAVRLGFALYPLAMYPTHPELARMLEEFASPVAPKFTLGSEPATGHQKETRAPKAKGSRRAG